MMNFDIATIGAMVGRLAAKLLPGWTITCELAPSIEANQGALAMVYSTPERQLVHVVVAPHPPGESLEESIAHELTHSVLSPLTKLIEWSPAAVMIEEQIVERLGKLLSTLPSGMARAMIRAIQNPRTQSAEVRKRISALAIGRRNETRKRMGSQEMAALAMEGGQIAAMEGLPPEVAEWIKKAVAFMASNDIEPLSAREDMLEDDKATPAMREEDVPTQYRTLFRSAKRSATMMLNDTIRLRLHTARTVDNIVLDADIEKDLAACGSIEQFEREFALVKRMADKGGEQQRKRSGAVPEQQKTEGAAVDADTLRKEGFDESFISMYMGIHQSNAKGAEDMLDTARRARVSNPLPWKTAQNGAAK